MISESKHAVISIRYTVPEAMLTWLIAGSNDIPQANCIVSISKDNIDIANQANTEPKPSTRAEDSERA
eukprot:m.277730 g.277730  ORF g.277730 m.277730 type:complete len:68 (+) comp40610_c0_seq3:1933-2136(+)